VEKPAPFRWTSQPSRRPPLSRDVWASVRSELVCISTPALCAGRERNGAGDLRRTSEPGRGDSGAVSLDVAAVQTPAFVAGRLGLRAVGARVHLYARALRRT